jgi:alpha-1,6-mannosyltransferase
VRIIRLANFVTPRSGGLRTALTALGREYVAAGHEPVLVVPGPGAADESSEQGRVIQLPGPRVPGMGGYRVLVGRRPVRALLERLRPDVVEVSDRTTLRWVGRWARERGVGSVMVSHESLAGLLGLVGVPGSWGRAVADRLNRRTAREYDVVVCTTDWAGVEFRRLAVENLVQVPLGVDLTGFHPHWYDARLRESYVRPDQHLLVHCGRLSPEKHVDRSIDATRALRAGGVDAILVVAGDGPSREQLVRRAAGVPVHFLGHVPDKQALAGLLASADVVIAPGPVETFGLAALEALACGTPVVCDAASALPEVIGAAGRAVVADPAAFAGAVRDLLARPEPDRRLAARQRAERFGWAESAAGFLAAYETAVDRAQAERRTAVSSRATT